MVLTEIRDLTGWVDQWTEGVTNDPLQPQPVWSQFAIITMIGQEAPTNQLIWKTVYYWRRTIPAILGRYFIDPFQPTIGPSRPGTQYCEASVDSLVMARRYC